MAETSIVPGLRIVGLLGGVGAGKSTAARALAAALPASVEARILAADEEVDRLLDSGDLPRRIEAALGPGLLDGRGGIDRHALGRRVFFDPPARRRLEDLLHPEVRRALHAGLAEAEASGKPVWAILDVPLLLEKGLDAACDLLILVDAPGGVRRERACLRHGWTAAEWAARERAQSPLEQKRAAADAILDNGGAPEKLRQALPGLLGQLLALPARPLRDRWPAWDRPPGPETGRAPEAADAP